VSLATVAEAARALRVSTRTLQRRLKDEKTSFSREIAAARVRVAQRLLLAEDTKLTRIAQDVGCASSSHLSELFRRVTGMPPLAWRKAARSKSRS
jgi:AraC-like DNA-binding protein